MNDNMATLIDRIMSGKQLSHDELSAVYDFTYRAVRSDADLREVNKVAEHGLAVSIAKQNEQKRAAAAAKFLAKPGNALTTSYGCVDYTACRPVVEHIAGKPVFGPWVLRSVDLVSDAEGVRTFCTASELTDAMSEIRELSRWQ